MGTHCFHRVAVLAILTGLASSCSKAKNDVPQTGPVYILTTDGAEDDVQDVLLQMLQQRMKPARVALSADSANQLGTIHVAMKVYEIKFESTDRKQKVGVPRKLNANVTVETMDGSSNWDGEHNIGFEVDLPSSFSDPDKTRRRYAGRMFEVALKQLPDAGVFKHDSLSSAQPGK